MRQTIKTAIVLLVISYAAFGGVKQGPQITKRLPLDGVPGVVLKNRTNSQYLPGCVIVKLMPQTSTSLSKSAFGIASIDRVLSHVVGVTTSQLFPTTPLAQKPSDVDLSLLYVASYSSPNEPFALAEELSRLPEVQYAEPWFIYPLAERTFTPNDPLYPSQWALDTVKAPAAWDITQGDSTVVVAIVDSGVEWIHPDLAANIWVNPGETGFDASGDKRSNNSDDDHNGYVDDWHGWDFVGADYATYNPGTTKGDNDPTPTGSNNAHGTHVAGIVAAVTNNGIGVASIAPKCRILPVKVSADNDTRTADGSSYILAGYQGIEYAARMGANIINCSWGGDGGSQAEQDIIDFATQHGSLIVAAAGNEGSDAFFSPASYRNVLSVAATDQNDRKATFSNYGDNIDVCAPGVSIYSTLFPSAYAQWSGTSMASPLAAGLVALVKTKVPAYTSLQAGEQVRVTCDNIDALNRGYAGRLGRGRINALQSVTATNLRSMRLQSFAVSGASGENGVAKPADTLNVICSYKNILAPTSSGATIQLTSTNPQYITVVQGAFSLPSVGTFDTVSNNSAPFRVYVQPGVPQSYTARLQLTFTDGTFSDVQFISFLVNPTYATQNVNSIALTLTNDGRLGYYDYPTNNLGVGFVFNGVNYLFEGGLIIGTSSTRVVDVVRNETGIQDADFSSRNFFTLQTPGNVSDEDGSTTFSDSTAPQQIGLRVKMHSYAFSDFADSKYIILHYEIKNNGVGTVSNLYAGIFLDWDIGSSNSEVYQNYSRYDATRSLGYAYSGQAGGLRAYLGIRALDSASSFRSLVNDGSIVLTRSAKWDWISGGFTQTDAGPTDIHHVISSGPFTIGPSSTQSVAFALVAGDSSLANLQQNADAAKAKWIAIRKLVSVDDNRAVGPLKFELAQNYPNPFNPTTNIEFQIANFELVTLKVFNVLGEEVGTLVNEWRHPGSYTVRWNASALSSGVYFYQLRAGEFSETRKLILMK